MLDYPKSRLPTQPVLSLASFFGGKDRRRPPSVLDAGNVEFVTSGRAATALALQQMKIGAGDKVLIPAYHCASMVEPALWIGATPVFYKINPDASVDLNDVQAKLDGSTKVLVAVNYFGFPQNWSKLRRFCDDNKLYLLEDCAHSFLGEFHGKPLGSNGDYAIASSMKFFPIYEGGCLISSRHRLDHVRLNSAGLGFEVKAALNAMEEGFAYGRMSFLKIVLSAPMWLKNVLWGFIKRSVPAEKSSLAPSSSDGGFHFEPRWMDKRSSFFSRWIIRTASKTRIASKRRENYMALNKALADLPGCRPLFPDLPDGVFPYVYPLVVDNLQAVFPTLKKAGVPITRFAEYLSEGVDSKVCPISVELSRQAMQFPCHQDLRDDELRWMIATIREVIIAHGKT